MIDAYPIAIKRGTTWAAVGKAELPEGTWSAVAKLREPMGALVGEIAVQIQPMPTPSSDGYTHALLLDASAQETSKWPAKRLHCDIAFSRANPPFEASSMTFFVYVEEGVSR